MGILLEERPYVILICIQNCDKKLYSNISTKIFENAKAAMHNISISSLTFPFRTKIFNLRQ